MYYMAWANPASEWEDLATLAREMHVRKSLVSYPQEMHAFMAILRASRDNVHVNFHWGVCATLKFCYKIASIVSLANQAIFLCNQDVRARTTGGKRGFSFQECQSLKLGMYLCGRDWSNRA